MNKPLIAHIRLAWWFVPYVNTLSVMCKVFGTEPDWNKLDKIIRRAIKVEEVR